MLVCVPQAQPGRAALRRRRRPRTAPRSSTTPQMHVLHVQGNVYMLVGAGGNITVQVGDDGVLVVDTQLAPLSDKIARRDPRRSRDKPIRYIINTHVASPITSAATRHRGKAGRDRRRRQRRAPAPATGGDDHRARERAQPDERADRPAGADAGRGLADRHLLHEARRSCSSTAKRCRSSTSRPRTPTATASCSSAARTSSPPATSSSPPAIRSSTRQRGGSINGIIDGAEPHPRSHDPEATSRKAAPTSFPATAGSATKPTSSSTATWSRSSATASRT